MDADGLQKFEGGISREEGHKHVLENSHLESLSCLCQKDGKMIVRTVISHENL